MLTDRQRQIWEFLGSYVDEHGYPPTVREIGEAVGLASPSTVHAHLANLERAGLLKRDPTKPRALELANRQRSRPAAPPEPEPARRGLPLVGEIAAGGPLLAEENVEDYYEVPDLIQGGGADFLLRVKGDSMIDAGILDGDFVVVRRAAGRPQRRRRRRARGRRRDGRRGDGQALLPRERARPAPARELGARADLREPRPDPRQGGGGVPLAVSAVASVQPHARPGARRARARGEPRVPRLRRVRAAPAAGGLLCPECGSGLARRRRGRGRATIEHAGRVTAGPLGARGKSGHHRAGRWGNPRRRKPTESGTERKPPSGAPPETPLGKGETVG